MKHLTFVRIIILAFCFSWMVNLQLNATHIVGGEIYYEHLGGNDYSIILKMYVDCGPDNTTGTSFDEAAHIGIYSGSTLIEVLDLDLFEAIVSDVPVTLDNPCFILPPDLCIQEAIYEGFISLSPIVGGYDLVYQRCCRNNSIVNIVNAAESGMSLFTHVPGTDEIEGNNSAPVFNNFPPVALCQNAEFFFDHSATDPDNDELVYEFYTPFLGGGPDTAALPDDPNGPAPNPPLPPIYSEVIWMPGYDANYPIDSSPALIIDPVTGQITGTPNQLGRYAIGVVVHEYRDSVLINSTYRDFQYNVTICDPTIIAVVPSQTQFCDGLYFEFTNESINASSFYWDFGDPLSTSDTSNLSDPTYTYTEPGVYEVLLVANPEWSCADSVTVTYEATPVLTPTFINDDYNCINDQGVFSFLADDDNPATAVYSWNFGPNATPQFSSSPNPDNITFSGVGMQNISLSVTDLGCEEVDNLDFEILADPVAEIQPQILLCDGLEVTFINNSLNGETYSWDFDVSSSITDISSEFEPTFTYSDTGHYEVTLLVTAPMTCPDFTSEEFIVYTLLDPYFESPAIACLLSNSFDIDFAGSSTDQAIYLWDFGGATPNSSSAINPANFSYSVPGTYAVTLVVTENNCIRTYQDSVIVLADPEIGFSIGSAIGCTPLWVDFEDNSFAETTLYYLWDFGDGGQSSAPSPSYIYDNPGVFDVTLSVHTETGCVTELTQTNVGAVIAHPDPISNFYIEPAIVDILDPEFNVVDLSEGAAEVSYYFGYDNISNDFEFSYSINESGVHFLTQELVSPFGCKSASQFGVTIIGHLIYIPNSFTPNSDGINDVFRISSTGITQFSIDVFDRWGTIIYHSNDVNELWLGDVREGEYYAQNQTYTYHVTYRGQTTDTFDVVGHITIIR